MWVNLIRNTTNAFFAQHNKAWVSFCTGEKACLKAKKKVKPAFSLGWDKTYVCSKTKKKRSFMTTDQWFSTEQTHLQRLEQPLTPRGQVYLMERGQTYRKDLVLWALLNLCLLPILLLCPG